VASLNGSPTDDFSGLKVYFPKGIVASYYYPINVSWNQISHSLTNVWKGGSSYTLPYINGKTIIIRTPAELAWIAGVCNGAPVPAWDLRDLTPINEAAYVNFNGYTIYLANDIDMGSQPWIPIGNSNPTEFYGTFVGNGYTISHLASTITATSTNYGGLFQYIDPSHTHVDGNFHVTDKNGAKSYQ
jgi:hypothetical protein